MRYVELSHKVPPLDFESRIASHPEIERVEHSDRKPDGGHYMHYYINAYPKVKPNRFIQFELSTHNHYENTTNCSALYRKPPDGLHELASRILDSVVEGWELNPPALGGDSGEKSPLNRSQRLDEQLEPSDDAASGSGQPLASHPPPVTPSPGPYQLLASDQLPSVAAARLLPAEGLQQLGLKLQQPPPLPPPVEQQETTTTSSSSSSSSSSRS